MNIFELINPNEDVSFKGENDEILPENPEKAKNIIIRNIANSINVQIKAGMAYFKSRNLSYDGIRIKVIDISHGYLLLELYMLRDQEICSHFYPMSYPIDGVCGMRVRGSNLSGAYIENGKLKFSITREIVGESLQKDYA